jgi:hypothetical protein
MGGKHAQTWTPARDTRLRTLREDGCTLSEMARELRTSRDVIRVRVSEQEAEELPAWADKLAHEVREKRVKEAITLTPASTDAAWFDLLWGADALCFVSGRLYFIGGDGRAPFASVVGYFGRRRKRFTEVFGEVGKIVYPKVV